MDQVIQEFKDLLKGNDYTYTQLINGIRIRNHKVVYVFDDCKSNDYSAALICIASIIKLRRKELKTSRILVLSSNDYYGFIYQEISEKIIKKDDYFRFDDGSYNGSETIDEMDTIKNAEALLLVSNCERVQHLLSGKDWDLIIFDQTNMMNSKILDITDNSFKDICKLKADRLLILNNSPNMKSQKIDEELYEALTQGIIKSKAPVGDRSYMPNLDWLTHYNIKDSKTSFNNMINSNTAFVFEDIASAFPYKMGTKLEGIHLDFSKLLANKIVELNCGYRCDKWYMNYINEYGLFAEHKEITYGRGYAYSLSYHIVWVTKNIFIADINNEIEEYIYKTLDKSGVCLNRTEVMSDYIHLFISCKPQCRISDIVKVLKGNISKWVFKNHKDIKSKCNGHMWKPSYFVAIDNENIDYQIREYLDKICK